MIGNEIMKMIIAITQFFEKKTEKIVVDIEYEKERMKDFVNHSQRGGFYLNDDFSSWFDDFGEDWK
mgnify:FL=1|tara:strand:- start:381 stop:578 length:198 start_codon:yes stop_codon:yes gene_type:complete